MTKSTERFAPSSGYVFHGLRATGFRKQNSSVGQVITYGRTSKAQRQEIADAMATITETAVVGVPAVAEANPIYPVTFTVTHRIVPVHGSNSDHGAQDQ